MSPRCRQQPALPTPSRNSARASVRPACSAYRARCCPACSACARARVCGWAEGPPGWRSGAASGGCCAPRTEQRTAWPAGPPLTACSPARSAAAWRRGSGSRQSSAAAGPCIPPCGCYSPPAQYSCLRARGEGRRGQKDGRFKQRAEPRSNASRLCGYRWQKPWARRAAAMGAEDRSQECGGQQPWMRRAAAMGAEGRSPLCALSSLPSTHSHRRLAGAQRAATRSHAVADGCAQGNIGTCSRQQARRPECAVICPDMRGHRRPAYPGRAASTWPSCTAAHPTPTRQTCTSTRAPRPSRG